MAQIFVVDDEPGVREAIARILALSGHEVSTFHTGSEALRATLHQNPDLVVTDMSMPEMDGTDLLIRLDRAAPHIPVIAISGSVDVAESPLESAVHLGAAATVTKPFRAEEVRRVVGRVLAASLVGRGNEDKGGRPEATFEAEIRRSRVLVADDDDGVRRVLCRLLERQGYVNVQSVQNGDDGLRVVEEWEPDLVILDLHMPGTDGFDMLARIREAGVGHKGIPTLVLTGDMDPVAKRKAFASGAADFVVKPPDADETLARVRNLLSAHVLQKRLAEHADDLEVRVRRRTREVEKGHFEVVYRLAVVAEYRDDLTGAHQRRVGEVAALVGRRLGLPEIDVQRLRMSAPLHDIGKVAIPDSILRKAGPLTDDEWEIMRTHTTVGADMLGGADAALLQMSERIARAHHERWDGSGYPRGLAGDEIPLEGRITAVADVIDCMTHSRPYRSARSMPEAVAEIGRCAGTQFDPEVAACVADRSDDEELRATLDPEIG